MKYEIIKPENYRAMPWKNGLGVTHEIFRRPAEGDFDWRVSVAEIKEDGPFSFFPGYRRVISTLTGGGMKLSVDGVSSGALLKYDPFAFSGDARVTSELIAGPIRDFNLIYDPQRARARLEWFDARAPRVFCAQARAVLAFGVEDFRLGGAGFVADVPAGGAVLVDNAAGATGRFVIETRRPDLETHCCLIEIDQA